VSLTIASSSALRIWLAGAPTAAAVAELFVVCPFDPWLIWNLSVTTAGLVATLTIVWSLPRLAFRCALIASLGWLGISISAEWFHRSRLPSDIGVTGIVVEAWQSGLTDRCGATVFRLGTATLDELRRNGVRQLTGAQPFAERWPTSSAWLPTPVPSEMVVGTTPDARSWSGRDCGLSPVWAWSIRRAASTPGSFYRIGYGRILLLSPSLGVIAITFSS
jgi:hypothetical protein